MITRPKPRGGFYDNRFWEFVKAGQVHLQQCSLCGHRWYPPGPACPSCISETWTWEPLAGTGTLLSWVTFNKTYFPSVPAPYTVVAVQTAEGPILLANTTTDPQTLTIGKRMVLRYYEAIDENSEPLTLYGWEPSLAEARPPLL